MKRMSNPLFQYSLTALAVALPGLVYAEEMVTVPSLKGGETATIGIWYAVPSADQQDYGLMISSADSIHQDQQVLEINPQYDFGFEASIGYVFNETANGLELSYREQDTSDEGHTVDPTASLISPVLGFDDNLLLNSTLDYDLNALDFMVLQFLDIGTHVQMRISVGASYADLEKKQTSHYFFDNTESGGFAGYDLIDTQSEFEGFGPRIAMDARYDFGEGVGVLGGGSIAYYVGDLDSSSTTGYVSNETPPNKSITTTDDIDNHGVTNLRANVGVDYVYFFADDNRATLGIELGYQIDYYADAINQITYDADPVPTPFPNVTGSTTTSLSFSGPYLIIKGVL